MRTLGIAWVVISIPAALIVGRVLRGRSAQYPTSDELEERAALRVVEDQR
jgi:hypothetical protein